jgi:hypothetical protein
MNLGKIIDLMAENNINPEQIFALVERIQNSDLKDEKNLREIIAEVSRIAGKKLDKQKEEQLIKKLVNEGVDEDLFEML